MGNLALAAIRRGGQRLDRQGAIADLDVGVEIDLLR